jgi:hypothetical protein
VERLSRRPGSVRCAAAAHQYRRLRPPSYGAVRSVLTTTGAQTPHRYRPEPSQRFSLPRCRRRVGSINASLVSRQTSSGTIAGQDAEPTISTPGRSDQPCATSPAFRGWHSAVRSAPYAHARPVEEVTPASLVSRVIATRVRPLRAPHGTRRAAYWPRPAERILTLGEGVTRRAHWRSLQTHAGHSPICHCRWASR